MIDMPNRVIRILNRLVEARDVENAAPVALANICTLFGFDRVRSFVKDPLTKSFTPIHDFYPDKNQVSYEIDFRNSYYEKRGLDDRDDDSLVQRLLDEPSVSLCDLHKIQPMLDTINYAPLDDNVVDDLLLFGVCGDSVSLMGYFAFERFKGTEPLSHAEIFEVVNLCSVINSRILAFEMSKRLTLVEQTHSIDPLTGLPTADSFRERATELLHEDCHRAIFYLDVDKFKYINDAWSFEMGSEVLRKIGELLAEFVKEDGICGRVYDDKFVIMTRFVGIAQLHVTIKKLDKLFLALQDKWFHSMKLTITGGVYPVTEPTTITHAMDKANLARRAIKGGYKNAFMVFNPSVENTLELDKQVEKRMVSALDTDQFVPFLKPRFNLATNEICGAEAQPRWLTPERVVLAEEFLPILEANGNLKKLDFLIYEKVLQFLQQNLHDHKKLYPISLSLCQANLSDDTFLVRLMELVDKYQVPTKYIELQIGEQLFHDDRGVLPNFVKSLRDHGIAVSVDNFGTSYSSLNLLKHIEVDMIKLDKSFIRDILESEIGDSLEHDKTIVKNILTLIEGFHFTPLCKGIETHKQLSFLKELGAPLGQGDLFSVAISLKKFQEVYLK